MAAEIVTIDNIDRLGKTYWIEAKDHKEVVECKSGTFVKAELVFSGCKTLGEMWKWKETHDLTMRIWTEEPTKEQRENTPWDSNIIRW